MQISPRDFFFFFFFNRHHTSCETPGAAFPLVTFCYGCLSDKTKSLKKPVPGVGQYLTHEHHYHRSDGCVFFLSQGMKDDTEEGTLLGTFTYDENGESTQTFKLPVSRNRQT